MAHDMAITKSYSLVFDTPLVFDNINLIQGRFPFGVDESHPARIGVIPRYGGDVEWFLVDPCNVFHTVNAYEDEETGEIVLHGGRFVLERDPYFAYNPAYMYEWRLTPGSNGRGVTERLLDATPTEFPRINEAYMGKSYQWAYCVETTACGKMSTWKNPWEAVTFGALVKYDMRAGKIADEWRLPAGQSLSEPQFVPRHLGTEKGEEAAACYQAEDDGFLIAFGSDPDEGHSFVAILDAKNLSQGPLTVFRTPQAVPNGLHGTWIPEVATSM